MNCLLLFFLVYYLKMNWLINQKTDYSTNKGFIIMLYNLHYSNKYNFLPLLPNLLGVNHLQEPVQRPHGFPVFQWFYCVKGQGEFIINGQRSIISKGQGLLIYPHISHSYKGLTSDWTVHLIGFGGNACTEILQTLHML